MSITAECTSCGRRYEAPASMAGKRVRCKQCGNIFALPDASFEEGPDLDALAAVEQSFHSVDATDAGGSAVRDSGSDDESGESVAPLRSRRRNMQFNFPLAGELDLWLPRILFFGCLGWLTWFCIKRIEPGLPSWMAFVRLGTALLAFFVFVGPITYTMITKAGKQLGYTMPTGDRFRAYAMALLAFSVGYAMWIGSGGQLSGLVLGSIAGIVLATVFLWFFFRLAPAEIGPSAIYSAIGFVVAMGIVGAIYYGLNLLIIQAMIATKNPNLLPASPFGPHQTLSWISDEDREKLLAEKARDERPNPTPGGTGGSGSSTPTPIDSVPSPMPAPPPVLPQVVQAIQPAPFGPFDQILRPLTESSFRATLRQNGGSYDLQIWNIETWQQSSSAPFPVGEPWENRLAISPDGNFVARASKFPSLCIQVRNMRDQSLTRLSLTQHPNAGQPEVMGFADNRRLLVRWPIGNGCAIEVRDINQTAAPAEPTKIIIPPFEQTGSTLVFSRNATHIAIATKARPSSASPSSNLVPMILVFNLASGERTVEARIDALDSQWPVTPTGMAFSFDSSQLAVLFEQSGNGLLLNYQLPPSGATPAPTEWVGSIPARGGGPFHGSSLSWLPDGKSWLLYGNTLFSVTRTQRIDELGVAPVESAWVSLPNIVEVVGPGPDGQRQFRSVKLDLARIGTAGNR